MVKGIASFRALDLRTGEIRAVAKFRGRALALACAVSSLVPALVPALGCSGSRRSGPEPIPALSRSIGAQEAFRKLEARFAELPPEGRAALAPELRTFLRTYETDDRTRLARLYLAWLELDARRLDAARRLADPVRTGPVGAPQDFANVVEGAVLLREGKPKAALALLLPLNGKLADPLERALYSEELVRALVAAGNVKLAITSMLDWAEHAAPGDRDAVIAAVEARVREIQPGAYESGLDVLEAEAQGDPAGKNATRTEARRWLSELLQERLVRAALTNRDPELAKRLVDALRSRLGRSEATLELEALAATSAVAPRISGRTVGLVLNLVDQTSRDRSAAVVAGVTRALREPPGAARKSATLLATRDAAESGDVARALAALAGDGASILVAGVTAEGAVAAALYAERTKIPVLLLTRPPGYDGKSPFSFSLGVDVESEEVAITEALAAGGARRPARVGPGGVPCDVAPAHAGLGRFPTAAWKQSGADALVLLGDAHCTEDALAEAATSKLAPFLVLGLESAHLDLRVRRAVFTAGRFPFRAEGLAEDEREWLARYGKAPSFYEALGHDAALLADAALAEVPQGREEDPALVQRAHDQATRALEHATARLWSTTASGFDGTHVLARDLHAAVREADVP